MSPLVLRASIVATLTGCGGPRLVEVAPEGLSFDRAFPVVTDGTGKPLRVLAPLAIEAGRITTGSPARVEVYLERERVLLVGLDLGELGIERTRDDELALRPAPPPDVPSRRFEATGAFSDRALPEAAAVLVLDPGDPPRLLAPDAELEASARRNLTLSVPIDPEACGQSSTALRPFASELLLLPGGGNEASLDRIVRVDRDRIVALARSPATVYLLRRDAAAAAIELFDEEEFATATGLAVDPTPRAGGALRVLIAAQYHVCPEAQCSEGRIVELELDGETLRLTGTATVVPHALFDVAFDAVGRALAVGAANTFLSTSPGELDFRPRSPLPIPEPEHSDLLRVLPLAGAEAPHLVAAEFRLFLGDAFLGTWSADALDDGTGARLRFTGLAGVHGDLWAIGDKGALFRRTGAHFEPAQLELPPRYAGCTRPGLDEPVHIRAAAQRGAFTYLAGDCSALLRVRTDGCTSLITTPGAEIAPITPAPVSAHVAGDLLTVGGEQGAVWETDLSGE